MLVCLHTGCIFQRKFCVLALYSHCRVFYVAYRYTARYCLYHCMFQQIEWSNRNITAISSINRIELKGSDYDGRTKQKFNFPNFLNDSKNLHHPWHMDGRIEYVLKYEISITKLLNCLVALTAARYSTAHLHIK